MKKLWYLFLLFLSSYSINAQQAAFESEVSHQNGLVYFKGKPLTGKLFSDDDNIPNKCECTLEAQYKKGLLNGYKRTYYKNGKLKFSGKYIMGVKNGTHTYYYSNGKKKLVEKYIKGSLVEKRRYYKNGKLQKKETFENGKVISSTIYNRDGSPKNSETNTNYATKDTSQSTKVSPTSKSIDNSKNKTFFVIKNKPRTTETQKTQIDEVRSYNTEPSGHPSDGLQKSFYTNGQPKRISFYKDGLPVKDSLFYETGYLKLVKKFSDGELIHVENYYPENILEKEENYLNNKKHGLQTYNYPNGQVQKIETYEYGQLTHSEKFNEKGQLLKEENYKFGKKHGTQKQYDDTGKLVELKMYDTGRLIKHERYTKNGRELINIKNELAEIKVFNHQNKMTALKYENTNTKQPDSLWLTFDPDTGEKLTEKAYVNGKLVRKGQYLHNQKNGEWIVFWQNGQKETRSIYNNGKKVRSETLTYAKQIKNNIQKDDEILTFKTYLPKPENKYVLVRFDSIQTTSQKFIKKKILETLKNHGLKPVKNIDPVKDQELHSLLHFSDFKIKLKSKDNANKKFVTFIAFNMQYQDLKNEKNFEKSFTITPATATKPKYSSHYTRDKKEAFYKTLNNLSKKIKAFAAAKFPLSGMVRKKTGNAKSISEVYINLGMQQGVTKGDIFNVLNAQGAIKARLKIISVMPAVSIAKVEDGREWLAGNMQNTQHPLKVVKSYVKR